MFWTPICNVSITLLENIFCSLIVHLANFFIRVMAGLVKGKSKLRDLGNFVVVDNRLMEEFDEFKANTIEPGVILLPYCDLLQYWITKEKKRPFNTVMRFGSPLSVDQVDDLLDWVTQAKKRLKQGEHVFI